MFFVLPELFFNSSLDNIFLLLYSSVVTPVFEERLFCGILWGYLKENCENGWIVCIVITVLFALWHLRCVDTIAWWVQENRLVFTGLARKKSGSIHCSIFVHAVWNTFAG